MIKRIDVLSIDQMFTIADMLTETDAVISIVSPDQPWPVFPAELVANNLVLPLAFHDVDETMYSGSKTYFAISTIQANAIVGFVRELQMSQTEYHLYIHCEAGISRSPAIALAVSDIMQNHYLSHMLVKKYPCFNRGVYRKIMNAFQQHCDIQPEEGK